jgi:hypothetical protein
MLLRVANICSNDGICSNARSNACSHYNGWTTHIIWSHNCGSTDNDASPDNCVSDTCSNYDGCSTTDNDTYSHCSANNASSSDLCC